MKKRFAEHCFLFSDFTLINNCIPNLGALFLFFVNLFDKVVNEC